MLSLSQMPTECFTRVSSTMFIPSSAYCLNLISQMIDVDSVRKDKNYRVDKGNDLIEKMKQYGAI